MLFGHSKQHECNWVPELPAAGSRFYHEPAAHINAQGGTHLASVTYKINALIKKAYILFIHIHNCVTLASFRSRLQDAKTFGCCGGRSCLRRQVCGTLWELHSTALQSCPHTLDYTPAKTHTAQYSCIQEEQTDTGVTPQAERESVLSPSAISPAVCWHSLFHWGKRSPLGWTGTYRGEFNTLYLLF